MRDSAPTPLRAGDETVVGIRATGGRRRKRATSTAQMPRIEPDVEVIGGRYAVESLIACGGMGEVLLARDRLLDRRVAVKRCRAGAGPGRDQRYAASLRAEARIMAGLSHRAIARVFDLVRHEQRDHLVLEYVRGPSLQGLHERGPAPCAAVVRLVVEVTAGLACAHQRAIVHGDLKLENVLLARDGQPKLIDFGIARRIDDPDPESCVSATGEYEVVGTPRAMAPEQIEALALDGRTDLFALGVMIYELVAGTSPFVAATETDTFARVLEHRPPPLVEVIDGVPAALSALVERLLAKDPARRPASAEETLVALCAMALDDAAAVARNDAG
jgi:serine/threonine-protein kinase